MLYTFQSTWKICSRTRDFKLQSSGQFNWSKPLASRGGRIGGSGTQIHHVRTDRPHMSLEDTSTTIYRPAKVLWQPLGDGAKTLRRNSADGSSKSGPGAFQIYDITRTWLTPVAVKGSTWPLEANLYWPLKISPIACRPRQDYTALKPFH